MAYQTQYQTLFSYHAAMFNQLLDAAEQVEEEAYKQSVAYRLSSLHDILFHVLYWHNLWRLGLEGDATNSGLQTGDFQSISALRAGMAEELSKWHDLITGLHEADFVEDRTTGSGTFPLWRILQHLILHGMQHHSEAAALLTAKGHAPGGIDFIWYSG